MTETAQYPIAEVQGLYRTVAELRQRIADLESAQTLGAADRVILRELEGREMTRASIAEATNMHPEYVTVRLHRLAAMSRVERCGTARRLGETRGAHPVLWRIKA